MVEIALHGDLFRVETQLLDQAFQVRGLNVPVLAVEGDLHRRNTFTGKRASTRPGATLVASDVRRYRKPGF